MGWLIGKKIEIAIVVAALATISGLWFWGSHQQSRAESLENDLAVATLVNDTNGKTLKMVSDKLTQCVMERQIDEQANERSARLLAVQMGAMAARLKAASRDREAIYQAPGCAELGDMDIAGACPALAVRLRQAASGAVPDG